MADTDETGGTLDRMLAGLAQADPCPSDRLMSRVLADAAAVQSKASVLQRVVGPGERQSTSAGRGWLSRLFGHGPATVGLSTAAIAGVLLGFLQPAPVGSMAAAVWGTDPADSVDLFPGIDDFMTEG
jgi:hypothetical protein